MTSIVEQHEPDWQRGYDAAMNARALMGCLKGSRISWGSRAAMPRVRRFAGRPSKWLGVRRANPNRRLKREKQRKQKVQGTRSP